MRKREEEMRDTNGRRRSSSMPRIPSDPFNSYIHRENQQPRPVLQHLQHVLPARPGDVASAVSPQIFQSQKTHRVERVA